jgi:hypothetical protein
VNECTNANACGPNTVCNNTEGSYSCACKAGYRLAGNDIKTDGCAGEGIVRASCTVTHEECAVGILPGAWPIKERGASLSWKASRGMANIAAHGWSILDHEVSEGTGMY